MIGIKAKKAKRLNLYAKSWEEPDMYNVEGVYGFSDSDEISPAEEGFMMGYLSA